jgi:DNA repair protein RadC
MLGPLDLAGMGNSMHGRVAPRSNTSGHRSRLRKRLFEGGGKALLDHELVEYLLALAIPRRDTKPLARELIAKFGGIGPLLSASAERFAVKALATRQSAL